MDKRNSIDNSINNIPDSKPMTIGTFTNRELTDPKISDRETDVFYKVDHKLPHSNVSIPSYDAIVEAKEWVDNENKK